MDAAHKYTDREIEQIEQELRREYARAEKELQEKLDRHLERFKEKDEEYREMARSGAIGKADYRRWRMGQMATGRRWEEMRNTVATDLANTNQIARSIALGHAPDVYSTNHNFATYQIEKNARVDTSYTLYSRETVERLMRDNPKLLPDPGKRTAERIRLGKDVRWNERQLQSVMMQGILQGESIPKIAERLSREVGEKNYRAAVRNARTMMTSAQNGGRMDAFRRAQGMGIDMNKRWLATHDGRTRHWHSELDEVSVPVDQPFVNEYGEIDYPGDPGADPANVYNCRCTLVSDIKKVKSYSERLKESQAASKMSYKEWEKSKAGRLPGRYRSATGKMTAKERAEYKRELSAHKDLEQVILPPDEYAEVMSEINTHLSDEDRKHALVTKAIGEHYYTFVNYGFDKYKIVNKVAIEEWLDE